jgi:hypothetical protein
MTLLLASSVAFLGGIFLCYGRNRTLNEIVVLKVVFRTFCGIGYYFCLQDRTSIVETGAQRGGAGRNWMHKVLLENTIRYEIRMVMLFKLLTGEYLV